MVCRGVSKDQCGADRHNDGNLGEAGEPPSG
jgi:hypothetical protein